MEKSCMRKFVHMMLLVALFAVPWVAKGQTSHFVCDFEDDADTAAWDFANGVTSNNWYIGSVVNNGGSRSMFISTYGNDHSYQGNTSTVYAYRVLTLSAGSYEYSFDWLCNGELGYDYLRVALAPATTNFTAGSLSGLSPTSTPSSWLPLDGGHQLNKGEGWTTQSGNVIIPSDGDYKLVFCWHNDGSGNHQPPAAIDNIELLIPSCPSPAQLTVSHIKSDSATVSWTNMSSASEWEVTYAPLGSINPEDTLVQTVYEPTIALGDLNAFTNYVVSVKGNCGNEWSRESVTQFKTACGAVAVPYIESFEDVERYAFPDCWHDLAGSTSVYKNGSYNPITLYGEMYANMTSGAKIATPMIDAPMNTLALDLALRMMDYEAGDLEVSVVTDITDLSSAVAVDTLVLPDGLMHTYELDFSSLDISEPGYVIFRQVNHLSDYSSLFLDNIFIRTQSSCPRPTTVTVSGVNHNSATVSWPAVETAISYEVSYGVVNNPDAPENTLIQDISETSYEMVDLTPETTHYVWVRSSCGEEVSEWRPGNDFTTQIACAKVIDVEVVGVSASGISLSWQYNAAVGIPATQAEVSWKTGEDSDFQSVITDNNYFILQGLQPSTLYTIRIRTICDTDTAQYYTTTVSTTLNGTLVGDGSSTSSYMPVVCNYRYGYSQLMYLASELTGIDSICGIAFDATSSTDLDRTVDIYLGHTQRSELSITSYLPLDSLTLVADDAVMTVDRGWNVINFDTRFGYHQDSNLVVVVDDNTGSYTTGINFHVHSGSAISGYRDNGDIEPTAPASMREFNYTPDITFITPYVEGGCVAPLVAVGNLTSTTAQVVWGRTSEGDTWQVEYKLSSADDWTIAASEVSDTAMVITDLQPGSYYDFRVGTHCVESILYSDIVAGFTQCAAVSVPFVEDFSSSQRNPCWVYGHKTSTDIPYVSMESLYLSYSAGGYTILPEFIDDLSMMQVLFKIKSSERDSRVVLAIGENPNDINAFEAIDTFAVTNLNGFNPQSCSLAGYQGVGHYIAFYTLDGKLYLDDVVVDMIPDCGIPSNITAFNLTETSVTLNWEGGSNATNEWMLVYNVSSATHCDTVTVSTGDIPYLLDGLAANTQYELMVYNICGEDTVAALAPVRFKTECAEISLPYSNDFNNETAFTYPDCWHTTGFHYYGTDYDDFTAPEIAISDASHNKVMKFGDNADFITPRIPAEANSIKLLFEAKADNAEYTGQLAVGYTPSPTDISQAVYVDTIYFTDEQWHQYDITFTNLSITDEGYVVFKNINNTYEYDYYLYYYDGYIDNLTIMEDNGCHSVTDVAVSAITPDGATISFVDEDASGSYTIGYSTANDPNNITSTVSCSASPYVLTGLEQGTTYYIWVRSDCSQGSSMWTAGPSFTTSCNAITDLPYIENFDSYEVDNRSSVNPPADYPYHLTPSCWSFLEMSDSRSTYPQAYLFYGNSFNYADSATCLMFSSSNQKSLYAVLPSFASHLSNLQISFTYCNEGVGDKNGTLQLGVMTDISDTATFTPLCTYPQQPTVTAASHNFVNDNLDASTDYVIAFRYQGGTRSNYFLAIDNVKVDVADDCPMPEMITLTDVTDTEASFSWLGSASGYSVQYRAQSATEWTDAPNAITNATTLTGLSSNTEYELRLQSNCGSTHSDWTTPLPFTTECGRVAIPYSENFDSYTTDISSDQSAPSHYPNHTMPRCWSFPVLSLSTPRAFLSSYAGYAVSGNCLFLTSSSSTYLYLAMPMMDANLDELMISFTYRNESLVMYNPELELGVMTNPNDLSTFTALDTFPVSNTLTTVEHVFLNDAQLNTNTDYYIAFRFGGDGNNYYLGIDNVVVDYAPTCPTPAAPSVSQLTSDEVTLDWTATATQYEVAYKTPEADAWTAQTIATNSITLTGLTASTDYTARIRAICGVGDTSNWSNLVTFTTECGPYSLPFSEDFNDGLSLSDFDCWAIYTGLLSSVQAGTASLTPSSYVWVFSSSHEMENGGINASIDIWGTRTNGWLVTPTITLNATANLDFDIARHDFNELFDNDDQFSVLVTNDNGASWAVVHTWPGNTFNTIPSYFDSSLHVTVDLSQYVGDNVRIAFYGESTISGGDHYIHIDNVAVSASSTIVCSNPTHLEVDDIEATSATLSWMGEANSYEVAYRATGAQEWTSQSITETSLQLQSLQPATTYDWRVRALCEGATSEWVASTFTTADIPLVCDIPTQLSAIAEAHSASIDWTASEGQSEWEVSLTAIGMDEILEIVDEHPTVVDDLVPATTYTVKVRAICSSELYSDWSEAIEFTTDECASVSQVEVTNITTTTATVSWQPAEDQSKWEVMWGEQDFDISQGESAETESTTYTLKNLSPDTYYDVYVRALCGDDFISLWSQRVTFQTEPQTEGINGVEGNYQFTIYPNPTHGSTTISLQGVEGQVTISVVDMNGRTINSETIECGVDCEKRIDVAGLAQGTYFVRVLGDNLNSVRKLIVR